MFNLRSLCLFVCSGVHHVMRIWVKLRISYKKQELLILGVFDGSVLLIFLVFRAVFYWSVCIKREKQLVMYICFRGIVFLLYFCDFTIGLCNCSDYMLLSFLFFLFILLLQVRENQKGNQNWTIQKHMQQYSNIYFPGSLTYEVRKHITHS
jgi:hypothetical protein